MATEEHNTNSCNENNTNKGSSTKDYGEPNKELTRGKIECPECEFENVNFFYISNYPCCTYSL